MRLNCVDEVIYLLSEKSDYGGICKMKHRQRLLYFLPHAQNQDPK